MCQVGIFQDLSEKEALFIIVMGAAADFVHIAHGIKSWAGTASGIDRLEAVPDPIAVLDIG